MNIFVVIVISRLPGRNWWCRTCGGNRRMRVDETEIQSWTGGTKPVDRRDAGTLLLIIQQYVKPVLSPNIHTQMVTKLLEFHRNVDEKTDEGIIRANGESPRNGKYVSRLYIAAV
ncbi:unnamed protein product [Didymodactylos carnosus]|uniref:Uncharacterized protein n=1 Tax=Didymodactylos carnosus TaxID=1234261 RepID=A0A815QB03_9BILA|nr:unnamed protein product [Didymodactylos carnosus]CAF1459689.1 unnamed protein product [Didymodactylos carnosus]CAF4124990.1 unnamed protein product [Didymodactylos carnosus]CAF4330307.1 unnamed protein product [Didymodactylos carnosus]